MIELYLWLVMACAVIVFIFGFVAARLIEQFNVMLFSGYYREALKYLAASLLYICMCAFAFKYSFAGFFFV